MNKIDMKEKEYRGSPTTVVVILIITSPILYIVLYSILNAGWWLAILAAAFEIYLCLDVLTSRIVIRNGKICSYKFYRLKWSASIDDIFVKNGRGGDLGTVSALVITKKNGSKIGDILKTYFSKRDIEEIRKAIDRK